MSKKQTKQANISTNKIWIKVLTLDKIDKESHSTMIKGTVYNENQIILKQCSNTIHIKTDSATIIGIQYKNISDIVKSNSPLLIHKSSSNCKYVKNERPK